MHFVYMLECRGGRIYTGYTNDVHARYAEHVAGTGAKFTRAFPPDRILKVFGLPTKSLALRLEARIKLLSSAKKRALALGDMSIAFELLSSLDQQPYRSIKKRCRSKRD